MALTRNGPAILAEVRGEWWLQADAAALATIDQPALLVAATDYRDEAERELRTRRPSSASPPG